MAEENQQDAPLQSNEEQGNKEESKDSELHPRIKQLTEKVHEKDSQIETLRNEMAELREQISQRQTQTGDDDLTADEEKALARIDRGLKAKGYVTTEELNAERRAIKLDKLQDKYDGSNGLPKFDSTDVVAYSKRNGFGENYEAAYRDMHYQAFVQAEAKKLTNNPTPPNSERAGGGQQENSETELTPEDIAAMSDADYEKHRDKILSNLKPKT